MLIQGELKSASQTFRDALTILKEERNHETIKHEGGSFDHPPFSTCSIIDSQILQVAAKRNCALSKKESHHTRALFDFIQAIDSDSFENLSQAASWAAANQERQQVPSAFPIFLRDNKVVDPMEPDAVASVILYNYGIATYLLELQGRSGVTTAGSMLEQKQALSQQRSSLSYKLFQMSISLLSRVFHHEDPSYMESSHDAQLLAIYILMLDGLKRALLLRAKTEMMQPTAYHQQQPVEVFQVDELITRLSICHCRNLSFLAHESNTARAA